MVDYQEDTFKQWLGQHQGLLVKVARSFTVEPADQEDLLQEILLQLWRSIRNFNGTAKVSTWIYRVAFNTAVAWKRGQKRKKRFSMQLLGDFPEGHPVEMNNSMEQSELIEKLYKAIQCLPILDASVVLLSLDGVPYKEMAEILGISENHVGVKLNRAKQKLADQLKGLIDEL